jgi:DNA-binding MarR family transcriptional regulator
MKLTEKEKEILAEIDSITDGFGEMQDYVIECLRAIKYDLKIIRGVIGSLVKKGYIEYQEDMIYMKDV